MWDLPGPGIEPTSPALAGEFLTTAPPGKSLLSFSIDQLGQNLSILLFFSKNQLLLLIFCIFLKILYFIYFHYNIYYFIPSACFGFSFLFFSFLNVKGQVIIVIFTIFNVPFTAMNFLLSNAVETFHKFWNAVFLFPKQNKTILSFH